MRRIYKVPFQISPQYQPFSVLIAHSSLLQLKRHYRTTTTSFSIPKECFQLSHKYLLLTIHFPINITNSWFQNLQTLMGPQFLPYSTASSFLVETVFI